MPNQDRLPVSIHAPARGATSDTSHHGRLYRRFNPRTREGCDSLCLDRHRCRRGFNPRTREGCDSLSGKRSSGFTSFNPRTREGCDIKSNHKKRQCYCFNPRTREGCDLTACLVAPIHPGFQSTHPRGVRPINKIGFFMLGKVSIHAPARGATKKEVKELETQMFQSTHPRGVRLYILALVFLFLCFNPRTREGCDISLGVVFDRR